MSAKPNPDVRRPTYVSRPSELDIVAALAYVVLGVVVPLHEGAAATHVTQAGLAGIALGAATASLPRTWLRALWYFCWLFLGVGWWEGVDHRMPLAWFTAFGFGSILGMDMLWTRRRARRKAKRANDNDAVLPVAIRATASNQTTRFGRTRRVYAYDALFADRRVATDVPIVMVLKAGRYPADAQVTLQAAEQACPQEGVGAWVEYATGHRLDSP